MSGAVWPIVLAGGEGRRMRSFVQGWLGEERPKQYCSFVGTRSMLAHTWDRARALAQGGEVVTVIGPGHLRFLDLDDGAPPGPLLEQPVDRGTATGLLLGAAVVAARDPHATVLVFPADHYVAPEARFVAAAAEAAQLARDLPDRMVLLGARPRSPEVDYGWILAGSQARGCRLRRVLGFEEKPDRARAEQLLAGGGLWNTMVAAVRVDTLWRLAELLLPAACDRFRVLRRRLRGRDHEGASARLAALLDRVYRGVAAADVARDLLQRAPGATAVLPLDGVVWSDWGSPHRLAESLGQLGRHVSVAPLQLEDAAPQPAVAVANAPA